MGANDPVCCHERLESNGDGANLYWYQKWSSATPQRATASTSDTVASSSAGNTGNATAQSQLGAVLQLHIEKAGNGSTS